MTCRAKIGIGSARLPETAGGDESGRGRISIWQQKRELSALITLLLRAHPSPFKLLLGRCAPPDCAEISELLMVLNNDIDFESIRRNSGGALPEALKILESADRFERIVEAAGGWGHIRAVSREWARRFRKTWNMLAEHAKWVEGERARIDGSQLREIAEKYGVCRETVTRKVREFPEQLAGAILK